VSEPQYYSQFGEDRFIAEHLALPEFGFFIEVGAFDGVLCSNTKHFEDRGWAGLVIEPDPLMARRCQEQRKCETIQCAVGTASGQTRSFFLNLADRGMSGLAVQGEPIQMPVRSLCSIMNVYGVDHVDLLSIDTEGTELDVWFSIQDGPMPRIVIMEFLTLPSPPRDAQILSTMAEFGYRERHRTPANLIMTR